MKNNNLNLLILFILNYFNKLYSYKLIFGSCSSYQNNKSSLWYQINEIKPFKLILLGDNIYTDKKITFGKFIEAKPLIIKEEYLKLKNDISWNLLINNLNGYNHIYSTWDDHDYGINNGDKYFQYKNESLKYFNEFFKKELTNEIINRGGVYNSNIINITRNNGNNFIIKVVLLDTRYFKDPRHVSNGDFLGEEQWKWLENELNDKSVDIILLGSSIQVLPTQKIVEETWSVFPEARNRLLRLISYSPCSNIILLSGDVHMAEVSQAFCTPSVELYFENGPQKRHLWEFTSSGLSHTFTTEYRLKPRYENETIDQYNYKSRIQIRNRGFLANSLFNMYQATYPAAYRENRFKDQYKGVHYGSIDVILDPSDDSSFSSTSKNEKFQPYLLFKILNHLNEAVITKTIPIHPKFSTSTLKLLEESYNKTKDNKLIEVEESYCEPYWGKEVTYRKVLFLFCMAVYLFILISIPLTLILWLIGTSIFYIFFEREYKRRDQIEKRYQEEKLKTKTN